MLATCLTISATPLTVDTLEAFFESAQKDGQTIRLEPGTYSLDQYLTPERSALVGKDYPGDRRSRFPMPVVTFAGNGNTFLLDGVTFEVDTRIYERIPNYGYHRFFFITGNENTFKGLTIRYVGANKGTNGNCLTVWGDGNTLEEVTLYVHGSSPYGYGDLLGKGGPNLVGLRKQSGIMIGGDNTTLKRCKVISRAFGHCFYIQGSHNTLLEDCYAEGIHRTTNEMLAETSGLAFNHDFKSVYENRDGRFVMTPGYSKALTEDGFRTYGGGGAKGQRTGKTTLINCTAINTRAGFEIVGPESGPATELIGCTALGAERGFLLINGNIKTRHCRGDITHGPLLYLWRGENADVEIELTGPSPKNTVHALATIAGKNHKVKLTRWIGDGPISKLPILLGYAMPAHAEMSSPILAEATSGIELSNTTGMPLIVSPEASDSKVHTNGSVQINDGENLVINSL